MSVTTRTITVRVDGDATKANKALSSVGSAADGLGKRIGRIGGLIAAAFSVQKIVQFGKESVQAMMADQKSAEVLAKTLKNVTKARQSDIDAVEKFISKTEMAAAVEDDQLRPAFGRLIRSTRSVAKSQAMLNLALDISAATGKDVGTVANGLSKAYDGNFASLSRLGLSLDASLIKSKNWDKVFKFLVANFQGSAAAAANTFAGRMERIRIAFENIKEDIGYALLPALEKLTAWMNGTGIKAVRTFFSVLMGQGMPSNGRDPKARVADWEDGTNTLNGASANLAQALRDLFGSVGNLFKAFGDGTTAESGFVKFVNLVADLVDDVNQLVTALGKAVGAMKSFNSAAGGRPGAAYGDFAKKSMKWGPGFASFAFLATLLTGGKKKAVGGTVMGGSSYLVGERGPEIFTPTSAGSITPNYQLGSGSAQPLTVNINAGSVIHERDLANLVRDQFAQLMRRRGLDPSILGV